MSGFRYSDQTEADIVEIYDYIAEHNESAAEELVEKITNTSRVLAKNPRMGTDFGNLMPGLRAFPVGNYVIFFRSIVEIVRVVHGARDIPSLFSQ